LKVFHAIAATRADARLIRVGGTFTREQSRMAVDLGIADRITVLPFLDRAVRGGTVARRSRSRRPTAKLCLPVVEAMACGTPVVASDIARSRCWRRRGQLCIRRRSRWVAPDGNAPARREGRAAWRLGRPA
jgi:glycosyltransferase involved in cell wall biosynthesis